MTTTTKRIAQKVLEFYNEEIDVLRAFEAKIKGKQSFKQAVLEWMKGK